MSMIEELKGKAKELLRSGKVELVIGYTRAGGSDQAVPAFIAKEADVDSLVWDASCVYNLAGYLKDYPAKKVGIVAKSCDVKSIVVLLQENQILRENIIIIGMECTGVIDEKRARTSVKEASQGKCRRCIQAVPVVYDILIKDEGKKPGAPASEEDPYETIRKLEAKSPEERLRHWEEEFSRCIRCYACRQVCPMCYCPTCVADQTMPAWFSKASNVKGNFSWNVTRAIHLAARCTACGECERVCPVGIPLMDLNRKIEKDIKELFKYEAGSDVNQKPLFSSFDKGDPEDFIK